MGEAASLILQAVLAAIQAAPQIEKAIAAAKTFIDGVFSAGGISAAEQDALHAAVDANAKLAALGTPPLSWTVEPDPVTPVTPPVTTTTPPVTPTPPKPANPT